MDEKGICWFQICKFYYLLYFFSILVQQQPFYGPLSGTTRVSRYQKKHLSTHHPIIIQSLSASSIYYDP